jgi:hypothetical protein
MSSLLLLLCLSVSAVSAVGWEPVPPPSSNKTNFLFIMYDDLRPEMSIYGNKDMITPNFERLAKKSVVFDYGKEIITIECILE